MTQLYYFIKVATYDEEIYSTQLTTEITEEFSSATPHQYRCPKYDQPIKLTYQLPSGIITYRQVLSTRQLGTRHVRHNTTFHLSVIIQSGGSIKVVCFHVLLSFRLILVRNYMEGYFRNDEYPSLSFCIVQHLRGFFLPIYGVHWAVFGSCSHRQHILFLPPPSHVIILYDNSVVKKMSTALIWNWVVRLFFAPHRDFIISIQSAWLP